MKKIVLLIAVFMSMFSFTSCETEDSKDPRPIIVQGQYVRLDIAVHKMLAAEHINDTEFGGLMTTPSANVAQYDLYVRRRNPSGLYSGNYVHLLTVNSFPYQLSITPQMLATALNVPLTDLGNGDTFAFLGYSTGFDGTVLGYNNLSSTVKVQPGMKQGYKFMTTMLLDSAIGPLQNSFDNYQLGI